LHTAPAYTLVPAVMFCMIERLVSLSYEFFLAPGVDGRSSYSDANSYFQDLAVHGKDLVHNSLSQPLSDIFAAVSPCSGQYDRKFFAPISGTSMSLITSSIILETPFNTRSPTGWP